MNKAEVLSKLRGLVAEIESTDRQAWADEPKTLTPQEAARALADGYRADEVVATMKRLEAKDGK